MNEVVVGVLVFVLGVVEDVLLGLMLVVSGGLVLVMVSLVVVGDDVSELLFDAFGSM
ncbi:MAG: hypothetical protein O7C59_07520 [Rickettsia endosymbiont of Ixodes persulcatus]|nr:hypothetical protein [Rickettsia endosymbiont of Ixodes persulcatus]